MKSTYWRPRDVSSPFGDLNSVTVTGGSVRLTGWTIDPNTPASTEVHVYVGSTWGGRAVASVSRPDVAAVYPDKGAAHGFDLTVRAGPGTHQVCVYAINLGAGHEQQPDRLRGRRHGRGADRQPRQGGAHRGAAPAGRLVARPGQSRPGRACTCTSTGGSRPACRPTCPRADVGRAYPASGSRHGYDTTVALTPGKNTVCVFAIDNPTGAGNPQLGCTTVTYGAPPVGDLNSATSAGHRAVRGLGAGPGHAGQHPGARLRRRPDRQGRHRERRPRRHRARVPGARLAARLRRHASG